MSEPEKPKRPWFRFHLSTALVLMLPASGFVWLNTVDRGSTLGELLHFNYDQSFDAESMPRCYGWPWIIRYDMHSRFDSVRYEDVNGGHVKVKIHGVGERTVWYAWKNLCLDVGVLLLILGVVAALLEYLIRREGRKQ